jgi:hypothetical protein
MIDIAVLASGAINILVPLLKKGVETIAGDAGKKLYQWVLDKFKSKNKEKHIEELKEKPDDERLKGKIEATLEQILNENPSLKVELEKLVEAAKKETISNSKNIVTGSIKAGGSVITGDNNSISSK